MKFFSLLFVLVLSFSLESETSAQSSLAEECREQRAQDNENSLKNSRFSRPTPKDDDDDATANVNWMGRRLESINSTTFESLDKPRTASLELSINRISEISNGTFQSFRSLRILTMRVNNLSNLNSSTFGGLMMLEELDLSRNMISDVERDVFRSMVNLHTIDLSANCMLQLPNYLFFRNVRLINIYLKHNHLVTLPILMPAQQFIESLNVSGNGFTNMTSFSQYNNIQSLDLSDNRLSPEEIAADVAKEDDDDSSSASDENNNYNYLNIRYQGGGDARSTYTYNPSPSSSAHSPQQRNPFSGRYGNRDRIDFSPDVNLKATSRARMNIVLPAGATEGSEYNRKLESLMDAFRPNRMSEEALESLIKATMETKSEDFKVTDMIHVLDIISVFYKSQNRQAFRDAMKSIRWSDKKSDVASFVQCLQDLIRSRTSRRLHRRSTHALQYTPEQLQQLIKATRTNHMEYFTCRNCSLQSLDFLVHFPELKYVDVSRNRIKTVNMEQLGGALGNMRYLLISENTIESLNFNAMLENWPDFRVLMANNNPSLACDLIASMHYKVQHLNKMFMLEVNKCK